MFQPTLKEWEQQFQRAYRYLPLMHPVHMKKSEWFALFQTISQSYTYHVLLESGRSGRYSFLAYKPTHRLQARDGSMFITSLDAQGNADSFKRQEGAVLSVLREWMRERRSPAFRELPDFCGGLLGFFSYDLAREIEQLPQASEDDLSFPDIDLLAFTEILVYDHRLEQASLVVYQRIQEGKLAEAYEEAKRRWRTGHDEVQRLLSVSKRQVRNLDHADPALRRDMRHSPDIISSFSEAQFVRAVQQIQNYIAAGDVFQVNLSVRHTCELNEHPVHIYEVLRSLNPSPYMGYLHFPERQVICGSPEQLVKVRGKRVTTRPIAGTRPRGANREEDLRLAGEMVNDEKERAEHIMLVDLERNDLGKVCRYGTVEVNELMVVEEYSHVMHIVSNVQGVLAAGRDMIDVLQAVFPGGTITGAPKVRTMEIIEELEPVRRGLYTGSIGWLDFNGDMELNIVIRTLLTQQDKAYIQAGAGIVIDSVPEREFEECFNKAKALWRAMELSRKKEGV